MFVTVKEYKAPQYVPPEPGAPRVFLAGAIDMGNATNWQDRLIARMRKFGSPHRLFEGKTVIAMNPRRHDWDSSWEQTKTNEQFATQVSWELDHIERSDVVYFCFPKDSKAPISFFELGLSIGRNRTKVVLYAEPGFYRMGNLEMIAKQCLIPLYTDFEQSAVALAGKLGVRSQDKVDPDEV